MKLDLIRYNSFILNHKSGNNKVGNIGYSFNYVRLK